MEVIFEDNHLIIVNKSAGEIVQGDKTGDIPLSDMVKAYVKKKYNKPGDVFLGTIHRLDRPTSGIVIFARTSKSLTRMNEMFKNKTIQKTYWAITEKAPHPTKGELIHYLRKNESQNKSYASLTEVKDAKKSELTYCLVKSLDKYHCIEVLPKTGRHHQIRVQLSSIGCIIKGDLKYGAKRNNPDGSIHLHARKVSFIHPVSKENIVVTANPPKDVLWDAFLKAN